VITSWVIHSEFSEFNAPVSILTNFQDQLRRSTSYPMNNATPEFDGSALVHSHIMSHFIAAPNSKPSYYWGKVTEAIPPSEDGQPWIFRVAYEDGPDANLNRNDLEADLLPVRPDNTHAIEEIRFSWNRHTTAFMRRNPKKRNRRVWYKKFTRKEANSRV
jgi:hypothetical protein